MARVNEWFNASAKYGDKKSKNFWVVMGVDVCKKCGDTRPPDTVCSRCSGHGLVYGYMGEPTECSTCGGGGNQHPPVCRGCSGFRKAVKGNE